MSNLKFQESETYIEHIPEEYVSDKVSIVFHCKPSQEYEAKRLIALIENSYPLLMEMSDE